MIILLAAIVVQLQSESATASGCVNETIRAELGVDQLPDCRAYELVSPSQKNGWLVGVVSASESRVVLASLGTFAGSDQRGVENLYEAERSSRNSVDHLQGGWGTLPFSEPSSLNNLNVQDALLAASTDLTAGLFEYGSAPHERDIYVNDALPMGMAEKVGPVFSPEAVAGNQASPGVAPTSQPSASGQLANIMFEITGPLSTAPGIDYLWPEDSTVGTTGGQGFTSLYEYRGRENTKPRLVGVTSDGTQVGQCGVSVGFPAEGNFHSVIAEEAYNAVSTDGSMVFFTVAGATSGPPGNEHFCTSEGVGSGPSADELFARVYLNGDNAETEKYKTVAISEPSEQACSLCDVSQPAEAVFQGASKDGSKVFFLSTQHLLEGSEGRNLYEYDFDAEEEGRAIKLIARNVEGVSRISEDGSHVYFVSQDKLTSKSNPLGSTAQLGQDNLYLYQGGITSFIGTLSAADKEDWQQLDFRPVEATTDGRYLVFTSVADMTSEGVSGIPQIFEYDAVNNTLTRVSAGSSGHIVYGAKIVTQDYTGNSNPAPQLGAISDNGSYIVFQSRDTLAPQAVAGIANVYEYHEGIVSLISDGQDSTESLPLFGIDSSGNDIFFTTADRLAPEDGDTQLDLYDARIAGGFPAAIAPAECEGDGCQGSLASSPVFAGANSAAQTAGGNAVEPASKSAGGSTAKKIKVKKKKRLKRKARVRHGALRHGAGTRIRKKGH